MAKTTITQITDDIDGSDGAKTVAFAFDGTEYAIDLGTKNRAAFEKALKPYLEKATKTSARRTRSRNSSGRDVAAVRSWAKSQGHELSERGRLPKEVLDAYDAAH